MASIKRYRQPACMGGDCDCPWRLDYRPQGLAGPRKRIEFPTKKAAEKHLAATVTKVARGEYISPEKIPTFAKAGEEWLRDKADRHPTTVQGWRVHLKHLVKLDNIRLDRIDVAAVERVRDELQANLGAKTISAVLTTCAAVFKLAQRRGWAANNPAAIAERPRRAIAELTVADETDESEKGLRAVRPDEVLSANEIKKLLEHRPLSWSRGLEKKGRVRPKFYEPKTRSGYRTLPLPATLVAMLKVWKLQSPKSEHDLVFCRLDGQPLHRSNVLSQGLYPALRRAELMSANVKTLRHSYASGLIAAGAPITEVQHRLGHSNPAVTLKVYSHWFKDADTGAVDPFAQGFLANPRKSGQKVGTESGRGHRPKPINRVTA